MGQALPVVAVISLKNVATRLFLIDLFRFALCAPVLADVQENPLGQRCVQYRLKKRPNRVAFITELIDGNDGSFCTLQPQRMLL